MEKSSREDCKYALISELKNRNYDKQFRTDFINETKEKINMKKTTDLISSNDFIPISDGELYWYMKALEDVLTIKLPFEVKDSEAFMPHELDNFDHMYIDNKSKASDYSIIEDIYKVGKEREEYVVVEISYQQIAELYNDGTTSYNYDTQREAEIKEDKMNVTKKPKIYTKSIKAIKQKMKDKKFKANFITWNILKTGRELYDYDSNKHAMAITKVNIIDGYHRTVAISQLVAENPDIEGHMQVKLWHFSIAEAVEYIKQEASGNPLSLEKKNSLSSDVFGIITRNVNYKGTSETNEMFSKIGMKNEVQGGLKYVTSNTFSESLKENFKDIIKDANDIAELEEFLPIYYSMIISKNKTLFKEGSFIKNRKENPLVSNNAFIIYNCVARLVYKYKNENWRDKTMSILEKLNITTTNEFLKSIAINSLGREDGKYRKKYYDWVGEYNE